MSNPNHDERGRFATGESVTTFIEGMVPKRVRAKVIGYSDVNPKIIHLKTASGKTFQAHEDYVYKDKSTQLKKFNESAGRRDKLIKAANAKAAAAIKAGKHTGQAGVRLSKLADDVRSGKIEKEIANRDKARSSRIAGVKAARAAREAATKAEVEKILRDAGKKRK